MLTYKRQSEQCNLGEMIARYPQIWNASVDEDIKFWYNNKVENIVDLIAEVTDDFIEILNIELLENDKEMWEELGHIEIQDILAVFKQHGVESNE